MKQSSHLTWFFAVLLSVALVLAPSLGAQAQSAGQISRLIPNVNLQHGSRTQLASAGAKVLWNDLVTTDANGRARIALDDGSILNVGSGSSLRVAQHDAANQRTQIQLAYGRLRASAVRLAKSGSSFEVRTPTAVAGVVGTEFVVTFDNGMTSLNVIEGSVKFCNLLGQCVTVGAGFTSVVRGDQAPSPPEPTPPGTATEGVQSTSITGGAGGAAAVGAAGVSHVALWPAVIGVLAAVGTGVGVSVGNTGTKCGCTTILPGGGTSGGHHGTP